MDTKLAIRFCAGNKVMNFDRFLDNPYFSQWRDHYADAIAKRTAPNRHGDLPKWLELLEQLPNVTPSKVDLASDTINIGRAEDLTNEQSSLLFDSLMGLSPWRKGPYKFFDCFIDTEWRSDWKWQRVRPHISDLSGRRVLDVGCGTGYHGWRMLGGGADYVLGIDPSMRFLVQFNAVQYYLDDARFDFLPIGIEEMPSNQPTFDSVFSMGVLYHRRNPINHLIELKQLLTDSGELILETLIVDEAENGILSPKDRYAQMRNVWSIMTVEKIMQLLEQAGFKDIVCVDQNTTSLEEQRRTPWMQFHSLKEFLDANDISKTIEGHPAPKRGIFIARK